MNKTISNRTFKWLAIVTSVALFFFFIFFLIEKKGNKIQSKVGTELKIDSIQVHDNANKETISKHNPPPKIIYRDTIIYKEKIVFRDTVIYKEHPPKIEYRDKIIYQEKPEPYHPYGKGNGQITLFKTCNCYNLNFWIDGELAGQTRNVFRSDPACGDPGAVSKVVQSGKHHITARDEENHSWDFYVTVIEDECLVKGVNV